MSLELWTSDGGTCALSEQDKQECGYTGISEQDCSAKGCCWSSTSHLQCYQSNTVKLGTLKIDNFALKADSKVPVVTNFPNVKAIYTPPTGSDAAVAAGRKFLSNFVQGSDQKVIIRGAKDGSSSNIALLKPGLEAFTTSRTAPGLVKNRLVVQGDVYSKLA